MAKLGLGLQRLNERQLPMHVTPATRVMVESLARQLPPPMRFAVRQLLNPSVGSYLVSILGPLAQPFSSLLHNTVTPTIVRGGDTINVIPAEVAVGLDGRMVPGFKAADFVAEVRALLGGEAEVTVAAHDPGPAAPDMGWFETLGQILAEMDPASRAIPIVVPGVTDARFLSRLGIQTYGYTPMRLPSDLDFVRLIHGADERLPVGALDFGIRAIYTALQRMPLMPAT